MNARYAINAANARWGSLYDALYGTDALGDLPPGGPYNAERGDRVIAWGRNFLDTAVPLAEGSHADVDSYTVEAGQMVPALADPSQACWLAGDPSGPATILLVNNGLHIWKSRLTPTTTSAPPTPQVSKTSCSKQPSPRSWTAKTRSQPSTPKTRRWPITTGSD